MSGSYPTAPPPVDHDPYADVSSFVGIFKPSNLTELSDDDFLAGDFKQLCPSGDCIRDCRNITRLFQALPDGIDVDRVSYGRPQPGEERPPVTLFGVCTNLAQAAAIIPQSENSHGLGSYFNTADVPDANITMVTSKIASCFASTCDITREPDKCQEACSLDNFLATPTRFNFNFDNPNTGSLACIRRLCDNTCGLPYADQDVLGIGVLTTYYVQAMAVIICAAVLVFSAGWQRWKKPGQKPRLYGKLRSPMETFLAVQTYFGVSAAIATLVMDPATVDPLNGYALVAVAIMGFLPPVFTLMLLQSHHVLSWFSTGLVFVSYLINSVTFFLLFKNLSSIRTDPSLLTEGLQSMFHATSCGGSSAMTLCRQLTGIEPLAYLDQFFNTGPIPNIKTVPILWGWTTLVLVVLILRQAFATGSDGGGTHSEKIAGPGRKTGVFSAVTGFFRASLVRYLALLTATIMFGFALGYQYRIIRQYQDADVIDRDGWSFGQVVAVLFWVPPLLDVFHAVFRSDNSPEAAASEGAKLQHDRSAGAQRYSKLRPTWEGQPQTAHSPAPSPQPSYDGYYPPPQMGHASAGQQSTGHAYGGQAVPSMGYSSFGQQGMGPAYDGYHPPAMEYASYGQQNVDLDPSMPQRRRTGRMEEGFVRSE